MKADRFYFPMVDREWSHLTFAQLKGPGNLMRGWFDIASIAILTIEGIGKHALEISQTRFGRMERKIHVPEREPSEIIESNHMVYVRMRVEDGIYPADILSETLRAEIGAGIDDPTTGICLDVNRGTESLVAWI